MVISAINSVFKQPNRQPQASPFSRQPLGRSIRFASTIEGTDPDFQRFKDIVNGRNTSKDVVERIIKRDFTAGPGGVSLPVPTIDRPQFSYRPNRTGEGKGGDDQQPQQSGAGSGPGNVGDVIEQKKPGKGKGKGGGGEDPDQEGASTPWQPQYNLSQIAEIFGEEFGLPFIEPVGKGSLNQEETTWRPKTTAPPGRIINRETMRQAMGREIANAEQEGREIDIEHMAILKPDIRRMTPQVKLRPLSRAVIIYNMDVSASVSGSEKEMARTNNFLLSNWIKYCYGQAAAKTLNQKYTDKEFYGKGVSERFIIYTTGAKEVPEEQFYTTGLTGGTQISTGYEKTEEIIDKDYPAKDFNIYVFGYSDSDNSSSDSERCFGIIDRLFKKRVRRLGYCHLGSLGSNMFSSSAPEFYTGLQRKYKDNNHFAHAVLDTPSLETYRKAVKAMLEEKKEGGKK